MAKTIFTRDDIIAAGLKIMAEGGLSQLSARRVADELGSSTAPVYSNFTNMQELSEAVKRAAVAQLLAATRDGQTADGCLNIGLGVLKFVWERPAVYASLFLEPTTGYVPGPDLMEALVEAMADLPELDPLSLAERIIVLKKLALFTHGLATEICQGCDDHHSRESMVALLAEVGEAVVAHARNGIERDPELTRQMIVLRDPAGVAPDSPNPNQEDIEP